MNTLNLPELSEIVGGTDEEIMWQQILALYNYQVEQAEAAFLRWLNSGSAN